MTSDASEKVEEFDEDINTTAPQEKSSVWKMPAPVFRKTSGRLPKDFERRVGEMGAVNIVPESDEPSGSSIPEPRPKSPTLKNVVIALALAAMIAFLVVFLSVVYFFFLRGNGTD